MGIMEDMVGASSEPKDMEQDPDKTPFGNAAR